MKPIVIFQEQGVKAFEIIMKNGGKRNSRRKGDVKQIARLHGTLKAPRIKHPLLVTAIAVTSSGCLIRGAFKVPWSLAICFTSPFRLEFLLPPFFIIISKAFTPCSWKITIGFIIRHSDALIL